MKKNKLPKLNLQMHAGMNPDLDQSKKDEIMQKLNESLKEGNEEGFAQTFTEFAEYLQQSVLAEAEGTLAKAEGIIQSVDTNVLVGRGVRQLTSKENEYYQKTIEAMQSTNPKQALTELDVVMPETIIDAVFDDLKEEHELLSVINFQNTSGIIKMLLNTHGNQLATWDKLCTEIVTELTSGFKMVDMSLNKLSAFIPVCKDMLDLGPKWLDRYVRTILGEAIAFGLEEAIINGTGKDQPIGMNRQVGEDVTVTGGVYPVKDTVNITALDPQTFGTILAPMTKVPKGKDAEGQMQYVTRKVSEVIMIVNPTDYLLKIMPATTIRGSDGLYRNNVLPFPTKVVQSIQMPEGKAIIGLAKKYFMGVGTGKSGKIEYSDEYRFLEDERVYLTKLYGHGQALD
ncbi:MAG TPA: phage major capsid protein, partial [Tissierellaceae bacterium]|nr:phage major capsid protein [Tissierellaceae bacterium]